MIQTEGMIRSYNIELLNKVYFKLIFLYLIHIMIKSMFTMNLDMNDYNLLALNDIMRMFIIQLVVQVLFFLRNDKVELFSTVFLENTLFILLGVLIYWIVFNNVVVFTNKESKDASTLNDYYQNVYSLK